jgi:hypothetical protein
MFGLDLGKMLSGDGGGMGGMFGGSILNMVKGQLSSPKTRKMITGKVVEMAQHLAQSFTIEEHASVKKNYEVEANNLKAEYEKLVVEITGKYGEDAVNKKDVIEAEIKECYAETQKRMGELFKQTEVILKESTISKNDISILSTLRPISAKNEQGQIVLVEDNNGTMIEKIEDAIFIDILVKGQSRKTLQLDEFLASMLEQMDSEEKK